MKRGKVMENGEMCDKKSNVNGVSPHLALFQYLHRHYMRHKRFNGKAGDRPSETVVKTPKKGQTLY